METHATPEPAPLVTAPASRPALAHTTIRPLPKHSVKIAFLLAAALPMILLLLGIGVMVALNYNILNWME